MLVTVEITSPNFGWPKLFLDERIQQYKLFQFRIDGGLVMDNLFHFTSRWWSICFGKHSLQLLVSEQWFDAAVWCRMIASNICVIIATVGSIWSSFINNDGVTSIISAWLHDYVGTANNTVTDLWLLRFKGHLEAMTLNAEYITKWDGWSIFSW